MTPTKQGTLVCVGTGMRMEGQLTPIARSYIETSDVVVAAVPNRFARKFLQGIAKEYVCLLDYYDDCDIEGLWIHSRSNSSFGKQICNFKNVTYIWAVVIASSCHLKLRPSCAT